MFRPSLSWDDIIREEVAIRTVTINRQSTRSLVTATNPASIEMLIAAAASVAAVVAKKMNVWNSIESL